MTVRYAAALPLLSLLTSCGRSPAPTPVPTSTAYTDGFEVVVFDTDATGSPTNARALPLRDAEQAISTGATALMPNDVKSVEHKLEANMHGDQHVIIHIEPLANQGQRVRLGYHMSNRTYIYEYAVNGRTITPLESQYADLGGSEYVVYAGK